MDGVLHLLLTCSRSLALDICLHVKRNQHFSFRKMDMMQWDFLPHLFPPDSCTDAPALLDFQLYPHRMSAFDNQFGRLVALKLEIFSSPDDVDFDWEGFITFGKCLKRFSGCYTLEKLHQLFQNSSNMEYCRIEYYTDTESLTSQLTCNAPIFLPRLPKQT